MSRAPRGGGEERVREYRAFAPRGMMSLDPRGGGVERVREYRLSAPRGGMMSLEPRGGGVERLREYSLSAPRAPLSGAGGIMPLEPRALDDRLDAMAQRVTWHLHGFHRSDKISPRWEMGAHRLAGPAALPR